MARLPNDTHRTLILGQTGSGKSQLGVALLATRSWHQMPWVILDYKREKLFLSIDEATNGGIREIAPESKPPTKPGLYIMRPIPEDDDAAVNEFLKKMWAQEHIGLFGDEGFMIPQSRGQSGLNRILIQGRSKHVPVILLYQRPVLMTRFAVSQADFIAYFYFNDLRDVGNVAHYIKPATLADGRVIGPQNRLEKYNYLWYDVGQNETTVMLPAPSERALIETFVRRMGSGGRKGFL